VFSERNDRTIGSFLFLSLFLSPLTDEIHCAGMAAAAEAAPAKTQNITTPQGRHVLLPHRYAYAGRCAGEGTYGSVLEVTDRYEKDVRKVVKDTRAFTPYEDEKEKEEQIWPGQMMLELVCSTRFNHPHILRCVDVISPPTPDACHSVQMVFPAMADTLHGHMTKVQFAPESETYKHMLFQLLSAVQYTHACNVMHRDIKPSNVLVDSNGSVKLCDFGSASLIEWKPNVADLKHSVAERLLTEMITTYPYQAPEMLCGSTRYGSAVDMWSVGCIAMEALSPSRARLFDAGVDNDVKQRELIFDALGTPPDGVLREHSSSLGVYQSIKQRPSNKTSDFGSRMQEVFSKSAQCAALLGECLQLDPKLRITAEAALLSPYFNSIRAHYRQYQKGYPAPVPLRADQFAAWPKDPNAVNRCWQDLYIREVLRFNAEYYPTYENWMMKTYGGKNPSQLREKLRAAMKSGKFQRNGALAVPRSVAAAAAAAAAPATSKKP
jgi:serine/threonine protein kinase